MMVDIPTTRGKKEAMANEYIAILLAIGPPVMEYTGSLKARFTIVDGWWYTAEYVNAFTEQWCRMTDKRMNADEDEVHDAFRSFARWVEKNRNNH